MVSFWRKHLILSQKVRTIGTVIFILLVAITLTACDISSLSIPTSIPIPQFSSGKEEAPTQQATIIPDESPRGGKAIDIPPTWTPVITSRQDQAPASPPSPPPDGSSTIQTYEVQVGDTLADIAIRFDIPMDLLAQENNIDDLDHIEVGQILTIPNR